MAERIELKNRPAWVKWALSEAQIGLGRLPISYAGLETLLHEAGITDELGRKVIKSRIGNFASGRNQVPDWFIQAIRTVADPEGIVNPGAPKKESFASVRFHEAPDVTITVPGIPANKNLLAIAVDTVSAAPWITPRDVVIVDVSRTSPKPDKVYAYAHGNKVHFGKCKLSDERGVLLCGSRTSSAEHGTENIIGEAVALLIDHAIGSLDINAVINTRGLEFPEW